MSKHKLLAGASRTDLKKGLLTLSELWAQGYMPDDLERHYFLTWFCLYDGRILRAKAAMGLHRNTFQNYFELFGLKGKAVRLRKMWQTLDDGKGEKTFNSRFLTFYKKSKSTPRIKAAQNTNLIVLWRTGFTNKMFLSAYVLWSIREGNPRKEIQKTLNFSNRHLMRIISKIAKPGTAQNFWLSPLEPKPKELYLPRYHSRLNKG